MATRNTTGVELPVPQAHIELYLQGATVSAEASFTTTAAVAVVDTGALYDSAYVQAGIGGPILQVMAVNSPTQITLHNLSGEAITLAGGVRLIMVSSRPQAYQDALGINLLGSSVVADSGGRSTVYLPEGRYDSVLTDPADPAITRSVVSQATITSGATLTITPTVASGQSMLIVSIAWQEPSLSETLDSVKCNGIDMTLLASSLYVDVYYLMNPSSGSNSIVATWSGTATKAAVGEAFTLAGTRALDPLGAVTKASGSGTTAGVSTAGTLFGAYVLASTGVNTVTGTTTATLEAGAESLWSQSVGTTGASDRTLGLGAARTANGNLASLTWTLNASRAWGTVAVELLPAWAQLLTDTKTGACCEGQFGILATHYASLQAAIDALPSIGGVIYIPAGTYRLTETLRISKANVTLFGEGVSTLITPLDPVNLPIDLLLITAQRTRLQNLRFDGAAEEADFADGKCGIVLLGEDAGVASVLILHCFLESVVVNGTSKYAVWIRDTIIMTSINCEFTLNQGGGVRIQGAEEGGVCSELIFIGCSMSSNGGIGVDIGDAETETGMDSITLLNCTVELNEGASLAGSIANVGVNINAVLCLQLDIRSCFMEGPPDDENCHQMARFEDCANVTVDSCVISGRSPHTLGPEHGIVFKGCNFLRVSGNSLQGFKDDIINIDDECGYVVEFGNRDLNASTVPRITIEALNVVSMSKQSLGLPRVADIGGRPAASEFNRGP